MATSQSGSQNGVPNGVNPNSVAPRPSTAPRVFSRPFEVHEALPYSPFTSIIPFEPGQSPPHLSNFSPIFSHCPYTEIIPAPSVGPGSPSFRLSDLVSRTDFDALNSDAGKLHSSRHVEQAFEQVQHMLSPKNIPQ